MVARAEGEQVTEFFRFPRTPHIAWLGEGEPRGDKLLDAKEAEDLLASELVVEEKVDGANLGFSIDENGILRAQNRGAYVYQDHCHPQFKPLFSWLKPREHRLADALFPDLMLFGEWCYAVHSIQYDALPDWFLVFDVYDRAKGEFWSSRKRDELAAELGLATVPKLGEGRFDLPGLMGLLGNSRLTTGPAEGLYVRKEEGDRLVTRAKLVRAEFVQAIDVHWTKKGMRTNSLRR